MPDLRRLCGGRQRGPQTRGWGASGPRGIRQTGGCFRRTARRDGVDARTAGFAGASQNLWPARLRAFKALKHGSFSTSRRRKTSVGAVSTDV